MTMNSFFDRLKNHFFNFNATPRRPHTLETHRYLSLRNTLQRARWGL